MHNERMESCINERILDLTFSPTAGSTVVSYPFVFWAQD